MSQDDDCVFAVCRQDASAVLDDGTVVHFASMFDCEGDFTESTEEAVVAVAPLPDGSWVVIDLTQFEPATVH